MRRGIRNASSPTNPTGTPIIASNSCPSSEFESTLSEDSGTGTENDDHNPPRIAPRNLFDLAVGDDNLFHGDRYKWSASLYGHQHGEQGCRSTTFSRRSAARTT